MNIEEILTKDIKVELSRIRLLLFVIVFVLIIDSLVYENYLLHFKC